MYKSLSMNNIFEQQPNESLIITRIYRTRAEDKNLFSIVLRMPCKYIKCWRHCNIVICLFL